MALDYVWEKFHVAVLTLVSSEPSLQKRLEYAYTGALMRLDHHELPEDMKEGFETVTEALRRKGSAETGAASLDETEATKIAELIVCMYDNIARRDPMNYYHDNAAHS